MTDKKVISLILLPMLALTIILGLLVLTSPIRASAGANVPAQVSLSAWNPLHSALATTPGVDGFLPVANTPAVQATCTPDTTPMISYWPLDEASGTAFADVVDGNPGACTDPNCPAPVAGKVGGAQQFTPNDGIVITESVGNELTWANGESFSFEMWVNFTETCEGNKVFFGRYRGAPTGQAQWWVGCTTGGYPAFNLRDSLSTTFQTVGPQAINDSAWHHVVGVRDSGTASNLLYVDGALVTTTPATYMGDFTSAGVISMGYYGNSYYLDGTLDEVAVYDKALSAAEIANHYNAGTGQSYCDDAPVALDQTVETDEGVAVPITLEATDVDDDSLTFSVVDGPLHGDLSGTAPDLTYTPDADYSGSDSFTFKANDGTADSNVATVSITINAVNHPPVADNQAVTVDEDVAVDITLTATDPDGDSLTFSVVDGPTNGVLSGTAPDLTYTPNDDFNGADSFTFKANDGFVDSNIATISITVDPVQDPPTAGDDALTTDEDTEVDFTEADLLANDSDLDGDLLTIEVDASSAEGGTITDLGGGDYQYAPPADFNGTDTFGYTLSDGNGGSDTGTVSVTVNPVNDAPVADDQAVSTSEDVAVEVTLTATDVDGDDLTFEVVDGPAHGVLSGSGANLTYTPDTGFSGTDSFTFKVNDGTVDSNIATVTITVEPFSGPTLLFLPITVKANE